MGQFRSVLIGVAVLSGVAISGASLVAAQDEAAADHPAHIHEGSCADLNPNPLEPLTNIIPREPAEDAEEADQEPQGALTAVPVLYSETSVELNLDDILAAPHAINILESPENAQNYIACGDIGGLIIDDGLYIGLGELNDSGYNGVALLERDDDKTTVSVYLVEPVEAPAATPTS
ncbi:MAG: hypothetical protein H0W06_10240 [Chloroflexia bacterium]|nr:hypothetical protein [Chloroflexia bacterium]